jgi:putative two-component system response regulator
MSGGRILIVDDEPANVLLLERMLGLAGYSDLVSTTAPTQVEDIYAAFEPDLVLLDLHMPQLDGFAVMDRLARLIGADEYVPILVLTADATHTSRRAALRGGAKDFVTKPFDHVEVLARVANLLEARALHIELRRHNERLERTVCARTHALERAIAQLDGAGIELRLAQEETIHRLSRAAEFHDDETSRHIERMSRYCAILAGCTGMGDDERELLRLASKMHDIGKLGVPESILRKPGRLTPEEYGLIKRHTEFGHRILHGSRSELLAAGAMLAWTHHEKVDGSGYPRGLRGDEIPVAGRIAAIADVFDALTTDRIYRPAFPLSAALALMRDGRGKHFDADLLDIFLDSLDAILEAREELADAAVT